MLLSLCNSAIKRCTIQNPPQAVEGEIEGEIEGGKGRDWKSASNILFGGF